MMMIWWFYCLKLIEDWKMLFFKNIFLFETGLEIEFLLPIMSCFLKKRNLFIPLHSAAFSEYVFQTKSINLTLCNRVGPSSPSTNADNLSS